MDKVWCICISIDLYAYSKKKSYYLKQKHKKCLYKKIDQDCRNLVEQLNIV